MSGLLKKVPKINFSYSIVQSLVACDITVLHDKKVLASCIKDARVTEFLE